LADGRVVICGGEYSDASGSYEKDWTNTCEIYNPLTNTWASFDPPKDDLGHPWENIGDAPCAVLPNGSLLMGSIDHLFLAKLDPSTLQWEAMAVRDTSSGEESWVLMPDNTIASPSCMSPPTTWVYDIANKKWTKGEPLVTLVDPSLNEIGPGLLLYDGRGFFLGAIQHTAFYDPSAVPHWSFGRNIPDQLLNDSEEKIGVLDGPAAILVNGNVLFGAGVKTVN